MEVFIQYHQRRLDVTDLPNSDDGVGDQNEENDKRFDERGHLVVGLFEPRQYLHSHPHPRH